MLNPPNSIYKNSDFIIGNKKKTRFIQTQQNKI